MKKILLTLLIGWPLIGIASNLENVNIVPPKQLEIPEALKVELAKKKIEQQKNGYYETDEDNEYVSYLLNLKKEAPREINSYKNYPDLYDTHLKSNFSEIKLAFPFQGFKDIPKENVIGYAAIGGYLKDNTPEGWTGIKTFFTDNQLGACAFSYFDLKLAQGGVDVNKELVTHNINKKPATTVIQGNQKHGFIYDLTWYTKDTMSMLECANMKVDKEIMTKMMALANKIDKQ